MMDRMQPELDTKRDLLSRKDAELEVTQIRLPTHPPRRPIEVPALSYPTGWDVAGGHSST
jgi:hypothetical protein